MPMQFTEVFKFVKNEIFQLEKNDFFFLMFAQNIDSHLSIYADLVGFTKV